MSDRSDSNWGSYGNPNRPEWSETRRELPEYRHQRIFTDEPMRIDLWTLFLIVMGFFFLSGVIPEIRDWVYSGINFTEEWYASVDAFLDFIKAPQVPH
jgi:hypothetical protein